MAGVVPVRLFAARVSFRFRPRLALVAAWASLSCVALVGVSLCVGAYPVSVPEVAEALFYGTGDRLAVHFVTQERLPQALVAVLAGAALGVSGAVFQSMARNPLASPDVIGFSSGAATGAILVIVLLGGAAQTVALGAVGGGLLAAAVVLALASGGGLGGGRLVLIGLGVTAVLGSVNSYLLTRAELNTAQNAHLWLIGSLHGRSWGEVATLLVALVALVPAMVPLGRHLRCLELGDDVAGGLGLNVVRVRLALTGLGVALCAVAVSCAGPIPFVALAAPQIAVRLTRGPGVSLAAAGLTGAALLAAAHLVANQLFAALAWLGERVAWLALVDADQRHVQLPVGVVTALLGGAYLGWLLRSR
ncbi:iron chelate uptake ABC transporter family permease subunit [Streptomyces sp. 3MP-14]|uniref:Iron chelate uptake ABC transporter family permease subunit n=1 Tax=Streptomyces mimosae TaxID=2586635 RepID=A0A5N6A6G3_9ACTN|nr:iron chelate uptake ABC transporter family permease subunit [Streptomyces mimosae]KAB8179278.1 iron chelate uptake ABC transporter family permease subunit [Streptomyces sp. 3MP-14]